MRTELAEVPFMRHLKFELVESQAGSATITCNVESLHLNSWQVVHGGVIMAMLDAAIAQAGRGMLDNVSGSVTIEIKCSFFQPARGRLNARGKIVHVSRTIGFGEAEVADSEGNIVAKASATIKFLREQSSNAGNK